MAIYPTNPNTPTNPTFAKRATGAMFLTFFGCAWIVYWALHASLSSALPAVLILSAGSVLFLRAWQVYCANKSALDDSSEQKSRADRQFNIINWGQWLAAIVAANVLINLGKPEWVVVAIMFIVGAHFLPLARLFKHPPHYVLGGVLMVWALAYPTLLPQGPANPVGSLGAGLILWCGALYSLRGSWQRPVVQ